MLVSGHLTAIAPVIGFFIGNLMIRGVLDGLYEYPYVNITNLGGIIVVTTISAITYGLKLGLDGLVAAFGSGALITGALALFFLAKNQKINLWQRKNVIAFAAFVVLYAGTIVLNLFLHDSAFMTVLLIKIGYVTAVFFILWTLYRKMDYRWMKQFLLKRDR